MEADTPTDRWNRPVELTPAQKILGDRLQNDPEGLVTELCETAMGYLDAKDLTGKMYAIASGAERELGLQGTPYDAPWHHLVQSVGQQARVKIEQEIDDRKNHALDRLVIGFPVWYREQGQPRLTKALVKLYIQTEG